MSTQIQRRRGTTAQHSTFTGVEGELTVDTTKDTVVVHDGTTTGGRPLLREDQTNLPTSVTNGISAPSANNVALSTGGTGRLFIDASGRLLVGTSSASGNNLLQVNSDVLVNGITIGRGGNAISSNTAVGAGVLAATTTGNGNVGIGNSALAANTTGQNNIAIGVNAAGSSTNADSLIAIGNSALSSAAGGTINTGIGYQALENTTTGLHNIVVGHQAGRSNTTGNNNVGMGYNVLYYNSTGSSNVAIGFQSLLQTQTSGNVGLGQYTLYNNTTGSNNIGIGNSAGFNLTTGSNNVIIGGVAGTAGLADTMIFGTGNGTERFRVDSSGKLLVGTSTAPSAGNGQYGRLVVQGYIGDTTAGAYINLQRGQPATTPLASDVEIARINFSDSVGYDFANIGCYTDGTTGSGDYPSRLVFSTTPNSGSSPVERLRINASGALHASTNGTYLDANATYNELFQSNNNYGLVVYAGNASYTSSVMHLTALRNTTDGTFNYLEAYNATAGAYRLIIRDSGNVVNVNNSYGAISDIKLKENVVDANSQWDDIKALQVRNYNFKEGQTHAQIGLIAQEVELVSPGLVSESPDRDADGNDLGTVTKSVNYSVLYMKAVKALQEAMERIETLEVSNADLLLRVSALESA